MCVFVLVRKQECVQYAYVNSCVAENILYVCVCVCESVCVAMICVCA